MTINSGAINVVVIDGTGSSSGSGPVNTPVLTESTASLLHILQTTSATLASRLISSEVLAVGGVVATYIEPQTDATLRVTVKDSTGALVTDATVIALVVYSPAGATAATNQAMSHQGAGVYQLSISRSWSDNSGKAIEGEFVVEIKITRAGTERRRRFRYVVHWDDDD